MFSPAQLARAAAANQAAAPPHSAAQQQCSQLWTQLQELMQQREQAVAAREQQAAQYGEVEELLRALARLVPALLVDQQHPLHQLQEPPPAPTDGHAAALQVVRQLLQQASAAAVPATDLQPLLPAQQQGKPMPHLTPAQPAAGCSSPRSSTARVGLQDTLQETVLAMQHAGEGMGPAGQQGPAQPQHMPPLPGQPQQQQQAADELHALSQDMQAQLAHMQQLQATLESELQQAHLFSQYLAADSAAAAAFQAWQDSRQQAPPALAVPLPPPPPPPQQLEQAVQQQAQAAGQGPTHEQLRSSPDASAVVHSSRAASPKPLTATQAAAYTLGRSRSRSRTPQPEQQPQQHQQQQQGDAALQELGAASPSPLASAAVGAAKRVRPWADCNGSASAGDPGAAGGSSKRQRTDPLLPPAKPDESGPAGDDASAADAAPEAGSTAVDAGATGGAGASSSAAASRGWVPAHSPPAVGSPAAAAAAAAPKPHLFRPTIPDRAKRPGSVLTADGISADAAAAVLGDRGALPVGRPGKQLWTQHRFGGRRAPGRGDKGEQLAPVSPAGDHHQQQQQQLLLPGQGQGWCQSPRQLQPQQLQEPGLDAQQGDEDLDLDNLYQQEEQGQQGRGQQERRQLIDGRAGVGQLLAVVCQGDREAAGHTGAAADKQEPPDTLYAAADGRIFYSHQAPGPQQLPQEGPGRGKQHQQQQQQQQRKDQQHQQQQPQGKEQQQQPRSATQAARARARKKAKKQRRLAADGEGQAQGEAAVDSWQAVAEAAGRSLQPSAAAAAAAGGDSISNGHAPAAAAAAGDGGRQQFGPPSGFNGPLFRFQFQNGGRHPSNHPHPPQHSQQQRQAKPLPYHHQHQPPHHHQQQQQQHRGMLGPGGSKPRAGPRLGGGCGWGNMDEQDASLQDLQQQVAELAQQAAAVTAGGSDAAALGSS